MIGQVLPAEKPVAEKRSALVGIFWFYPNSTEFFRTAMVAVENGHQYGDWIIGDQDHATFWDYLLKEGALRGVGKKYREDYSLLPRGRVSYNKISSRYVVYHGNWLRPEHRKNILDAFQLPVEFTDFEEDAHYLLRGKP